MSRLSQNPASVTVLRCTVAVLALAATCGVQAQIKPERLSLWPQWESRIGFVLDAAPATTLQPVQLAQPPSVGLKAQSNRAPADYFLGAGYTARLAPTTGLSSWRFNADLGVISLNSQNIGRLQRVLQGEQGVEELLRELRLRPLLKVSVNYAF